MPDRLGYVVAEVNQASHQVERLADDGLYPDQRTAGVIADACRKDTARRGRRERYIVCEVIPVGDEDG